MASVHIVMPTYNGAPFLRAQLRSILSQDFAGWTLILTDDGSSDATIRIARLMIPERQLLVLRGPQRGIARNAWNGLRHVPAGSHLAFCDQDDVWHMDKLSRALAALAFQQGPCAYSADRLVTNKSLQPRSLDRRKAPTGFASTLLRNPAAGHTCIFSPSAVDILKACPPSAAVPFHDWWAALVLTGQNVNWTHDPTPVLRYRQHGANFIGARGGRLHLVANGTYARWVHANTKALERYAPLLTHEARAQLAQIRRVLARNPLALYSRLAVARIPFASRQLLD